jgi:hypothetical protein
MTADDTPAVTLSIGAPAGAEDVPVLREGDALDLPEGAVENSDGTVTLTLSSPITLAFRAAQGAVAVSEVIETLLFNRLTGAQARRFLNLGGRRGSKAAVAAATGLTEAKYALLNAKIDAADQTACFAIIAEMLGLGVDLPEHAVENGDGTITLPLRPSPAGAELPESLMFRRLTGADRDMIAGAKDALLTGVQRSTGMKPIEIDALLNECDGADVLAAHRVVLFLSTSGRRTGR